MKKDIFWQYIRGISIIAVIMIHVMYQTFSNYDYLNIFIRAIINFAVPAFIFMAGYFSKNEPAKVFYKKKLKRLLIPLIVWDVIYTIVMLISKDMSFISVIKKLIISSAGYHLYYIYVLIQLFIITPILYKYIKIKNKFLKFLPLLITPIYCLVLEVLQLRFNIAIPLYNYWIFGWFTYYYLGILIKNVNLNEKKINSILVLLIFTLIISILYRMYIFKTFSNYSLATSQILSINVFYSLFICIILFSISQKKLYIKKDSIIVKTGDYSFGIYLSHVLVLMIVKKILSFFTLPYILNICLVFLLTYTITYLINKCYYEMVNVKAINKLFN